jgi:hypothetical protein
MTNDPKSGTTATNSDASAATEPDGPTPVPSSGLRPPVLLDGRPLLFMAVDGSAAMMNAWPVRLAWTTGDEGRPASHLLRPTVDWTDKTWDPEHFARLGLSYKDVMAQGAPAAPIAAAAQDAVRDACVVMQLPGIEKIWLMELLVLQPEDICLKTISLTSLALLLAGRLGLDDDAFIAVASQRWFRLLTKNTTPDAWVQGAALLIQAVLDDAVRRGLADPHAAVKLTTPLASNGKRGRRMPRSGDSA